MNYLPSRAHLKKDASSILKGGVMALASPLLLPYLAYHALVTVFSNNISERKIEKKNASRDDLIDKKHELEATLKKLGQLHQQGNTKLVDLEKIVVNKQKILEEATLEEATNDLWGGEIPEPKNSF